MKQKVPPAELTLQLVALLPWWFITGSLIPGIRSWMWLMSYIKNLRSLSHGHMCELRVFHLQLWFITACCTSSVFTRQVSRVYKSKRRWWDCVGRGGGVLVLRFLWLKVPVSQSVTQPCGKEWLEELEMCDTLVVSQEEWSSSQSDDISCSTRLSPALVAVQRLQPGCPEPELSLFCCFWP